MLEVLRSGRLSLGPAIDRFEELFAEKVGAPYAAAVSSGTSGLHLLAVIAGLGEGDEVITSPYSFVASANCFIYEGATPVFADVDERTMNLDPAAVETAITEKTKAIVAVDIFGYPCELDPIRELCAQHGLTLIQDACEALGAEYKGKTAGLARSRRRLRLLPEQADDDRRGRDGHHAIPRRPGVSSSASATRAAPTAAAGSTMHASASTTASTTCARRSGSASSRSSTGSSLCARPPQPATAELLAGVDGLEIPLADDADHVRSWFVYVVTLARGTDRERVIAELERQGIADVALPAIDPLAGVHARALRLQRGSLPGFGGSLAAHARATVLHRDRSGGSGTRGRGVDGRPGLGEALVSWALLGLEATAILVTYSRLPPEAFYNVDQAGDLVAGLGRTLVLINYPFALAAIALAALAGGPKPLVWLSIVLCLLTAVPGRRRPGRPRCTLDQRGARPRRRARARADGGRRPPSRRRLRPIRRAATRFGSSSQRCSLHRPALDGGRDRLLLPRRLLHGRGGAARSG